MSNIREAVVDVKTGEGTMPLFVFRPEGEGPHPAVMVIQEAFGVNTQIQSVAHRLAEVGYVAVAPDLYYRTGTRQSIPYTEVQTAMVQVRKLAFDGVLADFKAVMGWLHSQPEVRSQDIGMIGFCMGGRFTFLSAAELPGLKAAGVFYGGGLIPHPGIPDTGGPHGIDAGQRTACPIISFWGARDRHIPRGDIRSLEEAVDQSGQSMETHIYEQADHGFMCDDRASYQPEAARDAWQKLLGFLGRHLHQT